MIRWVLLALAIVSLGCSAAPTAPPCDPRTEACTLSHDFGAYKLAPGKEIDGVCMSWTLENDDPIWVSSVRISNDGNYHHSTWFFVPETQFALPDGHWDCWEHKFSEQWAAVVGGVLYAQSTQVKREEQRFARGAAVAIARRSRIIAYTHLLNAGSSAVDTGIRLELDTVPVSSVTSRLAPFRLNYNDLQIPAQSRAEFGSACAVKPHASKMLPGPFQFRLHYVLPHFHKLGTSFRVAVSGGPNDGKPIFDLGAHYGEPLGKGFDPPVDLAALGAEGISFRCGYDNPRPDKVGFGIGDQEMCVMLGFADTGLLFDGQVQKTTSLEKQANGSYSGTGDCQVIAKPHAVTE